MDYFNKLEFIEDILNETISYEKHLSKIKFEDIVADLIKEKETIPLQGSFEITEGLLEEKNWKKLDKKIKDELNSVFIKFKNLSNINESLLEQLLEYKKKYPDIPNIYNSIINTYIILKDETKEYETILEIVNKFPDYIFGRLALAEYYMSNNNHKKIPDVFDNKLDIFLFAPRENNIYHLSEVNAFYLTIGEYYLLEHKIGHALICYLFLKQFDDENKNKRIIDLGEKIVLHELKKIVEKATAYVKKPKRRKNGKN